MCEYKLLFIIIQIASLDLQIDQAVYELYSLTQEEIRIVEGSFDSLTTFSRSPKKNSEQAEWICMHLVSSLPPSPTKNYS